MKKRKTPTLFSRLLPFPVCLYKKNTGCALDNSDGGAFLINIAYVDLLLKIFQRDDWSPDLFVLLIPSLRSHMTCPNLHSFEASTIYFHLNKLIRCLLLLAWQLYCSTGQSVQCKCLVRADVAYMVRSFTFVLLTVRVRGHLHLLPMHCYTAVSWSGSPHSNCLQVRVIGHVLGASTGRSDLPAGAWCQTYRWISQNMFIGDPQERGLKLVLLEDWGSQVTLEKQGFFSGCFMPFGLRAVRSTGYASRYMGHSLRS